MQASDKQYLWIIPNFKAKHFVHVVHQIGGVLYNPPTTKYGGSSSSTLVMTTSQRGDRVTEGNWTDKSDNIIRDITIPY